MSEWINDKLHIEILEQVQVRNNRNKKYMLERIENSWISKMQPTLNIRGKGTIHVKKTKINIEQKTEITLEKKYKVIDLETKSRFRINWTEESDKKSKEFRYKKDINKDQILEKANQFRTDLINRLLGV